MLKTIAVAALAFVALPAQAAEAPLPDGVWRGTVGTLPVHACLSTGSTYPSGSYFYLSKLTPIPLQQTGDAKVWKEDYEGKTTWTIAMQGANRITGSWSDGKRSLPITLSRQPMGDDGELDGACMSDAYLAPRVTAPRIVPVAASTGKLVYTRLEYRVGKSFTGVTIASFALRPERPGDKAINLALRGLLDPAKGSIDYLGCMKGNIALAGTDGEFTMAAEPSFASDQYLEATVHEDGSCGGAHPYNGSHMLIFDRVSGKRVEPATWLAASAIAMKYDKDLDYTERKLTAAFKAVVLRHMTIDGDPECKDVLADAEQWKIGLAETGLTFEPDLPRVVQACGDIGSVRWAELTPWLSPAGKAMRARVEGKPHAL